MPRPPAPARPSAAAPRARNLWYGLMVAAGLAFGLIGERRPFGTGFFAHPLVAFFIFVGAGLIVLRVVVARPVPELIPERALLLGCFAGLAAFLVGNFVAAYLLPR